MKTKNKEEKIEKHTEGWCRCGKCHPSEQDLEELNSQKEKEEKIEILAFEYTSRADMSTDIRDVDQIIIKINEIINYINQNEKPY